MGAHRDVAAELCPNCGLQERIVLKVINKKLSVREVELIREVIDEKDAGSK